jgi:hypothetical protein
MFVRAVEESVKYTLCTVPCCVFRPRTLTFRCWLFVEKKLKTRLEIYYS